MEEGLELQLHTFISEFGEWRWSVNQPYLVVRSPVLNSLIESEFGVAPIRGNGLWVWTVKSRRTLRQVCAYLLQAQSPAVSPESGTPTSLPPFITETKRVYDWAIRDVHRPRVRALTDSIKWLARLINTAEDERHFGLAVDFTAKKLKGNLTVRGPRGSDAHIENLQREFGGRIIKGYVASRSTGKKGEPSGMRLVWNLRVIESIEDLLWTVTPLIQEATNLPATECRRILDMIHDYKPPGCPADYYTPIPQAESVQLNIP